jgi:4'-phosphopantetheinyl transferase superfamily
MSVTAGTAATASRARAAIPLPSTVAGGRGPVVSLLDARALGLPDEAALRASARELCAGSAAACAARSYSFPFALVALHSEAVGCDIERIAPCDERFADSIRTPAERAAAQARADDPERDRHTTSLWSAKEALAKALGDALAYDPRLLESPAGWPDGRAGVWRAAALDTAADRVAWVCWRISS